MGPERGTGLVDEAVDVVLVGEVGADRDRAPAVGLDGGDGLVDRARQPLVEDLLGARDHRDGGALAREQACHRLADAAAGAGDDRDPPVELSHHGPVLRAVGECGIGEEADHVGLDVRRDEAAVFGEHVGGAERAPAPAYGLWCASSSHSSARNGSWNTMVWPTTPVERPRWASSWPMPSCGRSAVAMRKPSVAHASTAWCTARFVGELR